jgi:hypothetical protein
MSIMKTLKCLLVGFMVLGLVSMLSTAQAVNVWSVPGDFETIQQAVDDPGVLAGDMIMVASGGHEGAKVEKGVNIVGEDGAYITSGVVASGGNYAGFYVNGTEANGASISNFTIDCTSTDPKLLAAVLVWGSDDVTVSHLDVKAVNAGLNVTHTKDSAITHNKISGGVVGITLSGGLLETNDNLLAFNNIEATQYGILVISFGTPIQNNKIVHNKIVAWPIDPATQYADAVALINLGPLNILYNFIGFNDFRGSQYSIYAFPAGLENTISRNLEDGVNGRGVIDPPPEVPASIFNPQLP